MGEKKLCNSLQFFEKVAENISEEEKTKIRYYYCIYCTYSKSDVAPSFITVRKLKQLSPLNAELNPIRHLLAWVGARHIVHVSRVRVNVVNESIFYAFIVSIRPQATVYEEMSYQALTLIYKRNLDSEVILFLIKGYLVLS